MNIVEQTKKKMGVALDHLKSELKGIRTGRANPAALDPVTADVYGSMMKLKELATVSAPEARTLLVTPFDPRNVHAIAKGIEKANLGLHPIVDGNVVRVKVPEMDASVRQEMVKIAKRKCEEAKVSIRNIRRDANEEAKKLKSAGNITEDEHKKTEKLVQEQTDIFCKKADETTQEKEKEILTV